MKNKIILFLTVFTLMATMLVGCASAATPSLATSNGLSTASKLALGTLKLEGTSNAVTASEASQLVTLWEGYESISASDTISQVERDALTNQIEGTMTDAQIKAIDAMNLTEQTVSETLSTLGDNATSASPTSTFSSSSASGLNQQGGPSGGPVGAAPGGASPGGDSLGMGDILNGTASQSTPSTTQSPAGAGVAQVNPILLQALIHLLETRSQSAG